MQPEWQAHLDELMEQYQKKRAELVGLQDRMAQVEATFTSEDKLITVRVGPQGRLRGLEFDPRVYRKYTSSELAEAVLAAVNAATDDAGEQTRAAMGSLAGNGRFDVTEVLPEDPDDFEALKERYGFRDR